MATNLIMGHKTEDLEPMGFERLADLMRGGVEPPAAHFVRRSVLYILYYLVGLVAQPMSQPKGNPKRNNECSRLVKIRPTELAVHEIIYQERDGWSRCQVRNPKP